MKHVMPGYEKRKLAIDLYKHFATLSVACIAVIITFLPQLNELNNAKDVLLVAVISFLLCVICTVVSTSILLANIESLPDLRGGGTYALLRTSTAVLIIGFLVGVGSMAWLVQSNLA